MRNPLRSLWLEPRAPDNPGIVWWDKWLVAAVIVSALVEGLLRSDVVWRPLAIVLAVGLAFTLLWRRTHPFGMVVIVFSVLIAANAVALARGDASFGLYTMAFILIFPYVLNRWGSGREIVLGMAMIVVAATMGIAADYTNPGESFAGFVIALSPAAIGAAVRYRAHARSRDREQAVLQEREQLARELHDTVAHHVSAIAIQAQAGRALAAADPNAPLETLGVIEAEASRTLAEMRAIVGVLRRGEEPELTPRRGVSDIDRLGADMAKGPTVRVVLSGDLNDLAPAVDAALYRVAQESITNAIRHARHATTVDVAVTDLGDRVEMTVTDDGDITFATTDPDPGFGLLGMAERAKLLGGWFEAGPGPDHGWKVTAVLPKDGSGR